MTSEYKVSNKRYDWEIRLEALCRDVSDKSSYLKFLENKIKEENRFSVEKFEFTTLNFLNQIQKDKTSFMNIVIPKYEDYLCKDYEESYLISRRLLRDEFEIFNRNRKIDLLL